MSFKGLGVQEIMRISTSKFVVKSGANKDSVSTWTRAVKASNFVLKKHFYVCQKCMIGLNISRGSLNEDQNHLKTTSVAFKKKQKILSAPI